MTDTLTAEAIVDSQMREWERVGIDLQEPDRRDTLLGLARAARKPLEERVRELEAALGNALSLIPDRPDDTIGRAVRMQARAALREPVR